MTVAELITLLKENADAIQAEKMSAYMKNRFPFLGIPKPLLKQFITPFLKEHKKTPLNWETVFALWETNFREGQYVALSYLDTHKKEFLPSDIGNFYRLITEKSWWETVDTVDAYIGIIILKDESLKETMLQWAQDDNLWLRRVAIDFQQEYKEKTDTELLAQIIEKNLGSDEFFINKAIGWSLRDYSKTNPQWVTQFLIDHKEGLSKLSLKEASKYL